MGDILSYSEVLLTLLRGHYRGCVLCKGETSGNISDVSLPHGAQINFKVRILMLAFNTIACWSAWLFSYMVTSANYGLIRVTYYTGMVELWSFPELNCKYYICNWLGQNVWFVILVLIPHLMEILTIIISLGPLKTEKRYLEAIVSHVYHLYLTFNVPNSGERCRFINA